MVEFRKRTPITADTMVSQYFNDMYEGHGTSANLLGGFKQKKYVAQTTIAPKPTFGSAELKRLDLDLYVNSISIGSGSTKYPELASYLFKDSTEIVEGYANRVDEDIFVMSSQMDGAPFLNDEFDGTGNAGMNGEKYTNIKRTLLREAELFTSVDYAYSYGQNGWKWYNASDGTSRADIRRDFRQSVGAGTNVWSEDRQREILVTDDYEESYWGSRLEGILGGGGGKTKWRKCIPNDDHLGISNEIWVKDKHCKSMQYNSSTTEGYGNEASPANTIFEYVRGCEEFSKYDKLTESTVLYGVGISRFNTDDFLTGAQSLEMFSFWTGDEDDKAKVSYPGHLINPGVTGAKYGPVDRQEQVLVKKNIPYPMDAPVNPTATHNTYDTYDASEHASAISMKIKIKNMARAYAYRQNGGAMHVKPSTSPESLWLDTPNYGGVLITGHSADGQPDNVTDDYYFTLRRGLHICFGTVPPDEGETLFDYVGRMANLDTHFSNNATEGATIEGARANTTFGDGRSFSIANTVTVVAATSSSTTVVVDGITGEDGIAGMPSNNVTYFPSVGNNQTYYVFASEAGTNLNGADENPVRVIGASAKVNGEQTLTLNQSQSLAADKTLFLVHQKDMLWSVRMSKNKTANFAGVSLLRIGTDGNTSQSGSGDRLNNGDLTEGIAVIPWNGAPGSSSTNVIEPSEGLYITDCENTDTKDLMFGCGIDFGSIGTTSAGGGQSGCAGSAVGGILTNTLALDEWIDLTFVCSPSDSVALTGALEGSQPGNPGASIETDAATTLHSHHSFGRLYISSTSDGFIKIANPYSAGTKPYLDIGLLADKGGFASYNDDKSKWPQHMSIWVNNYKVSVNNQSNSTVGIFTSRMRDQLNRQATSVDTKTVVLIDSISFRDFNFKQTNASQIPENSPSSPIRIQQGTAMIPPTGTAVGMSGFTDYIDSRKNSSPTVLSFGFTDQSYLTSVGTTVSPAATQINTGWTEWPYGLWLNGFRASNLSSLGTIPDAHIKASVSSGYATTTTFVPFGDNLGQLAMDGNNQISINQSNQNHNQLPSRAISTSWLNTGMTVDSNSGDDTTETFSCNDNTALGNVGIPIRVGDKVRFSNASSQSAETTVTGVTGGTIANSLVFTTADLGISDDAYEDRIISVQTPGLCRNFSQKGGFQFWANSLDTGSTNNKFHAIKRENIACSARIVEIIQKRGDEVTLLVDSMAPFKTDKNEEYIAYLKGETPTVDSPAPSHQIGSDSTKAKTGIKVIGRDYSAKTVTLAWGGEANSGAEILTYANLFRLFISPYRFWLNVIINLTDSDGVALSPRSYDNAILMNNNWTDSDAKKRSWTGEELGLLFNADSVGTAFVNRKGFGTTFNESIYNDDTTGGVNGAYINNWTLDRMKDHSHLNIDKDFGFGAYDEDTLSGGHTATVIAKDGQYNTLRMHEVVNVANLEVNDTINFLIDYKEVGISHTTNVTTRENTTNPPYLYSIFEDTLPASPLLTIKPNEDDPFLPEFTWEAADDDLWYGLLHIDSSNINSQYHNSVAHIPLNEDTTGFGSVYLENESGTKIAAIVGAFSNSYEGLAGFTKDFNGTSDYIKYADFTAPTEEMTVVVHIIPDSASGTSYILNKTVSGQTYSDWEIYMDSSRQIVAKLLPVGVSTSVGNLTLTSTPITVDGETPTCIILTLDKNLKTGNGKLFINGKVEDQSGLVKASPTINNWMNNTNLLDSSGPLFIGCDVGANGSTLSSHFDGKIEEIVIYNKCLYPVVPSDGKFIFTKPVPEISNQSALSYSARLFVKDYHNIRGSTAQEVASSSPVSYRKAAFRLVD